MTDTSGLKSDALPVRSKRRVYGKDFKMQAVRRLMQGMSRAQLSQEYGVPIGMANKWLSQWQKDPVHAFRGHGRRKLHQEKMQRLRGRVRKLMAERDLLKKALACFASNRNLHSGSLQSIERHGRLDGCARFSMSRTVGITVGLSDRHEIRE